MRSKKQLLVIAFMVVLIVFVQCSKIMEKPPTDDLSDHNKKNPFNEHRSLVSDGKDIFRFDTFGDEDFWSGLLHIDKAILGAGNGGFGPGVSPKTALSVGLKVDVDALP